VKMRRRIFLASLALFVAGCGYSMVGAGHLPKEIKVVEVARIESRDLDPVFADSLTRELRRVLRAGGRVRPAKAGERSDAVLAVRMTDERVRAVAIDAFDDVLDYTSTVAVDASLLSADGTIVWAGERIAVSRGHAAVPGAVVKTSAAFQVEERLEIDALESFNNVQLGEERLAVARERMASDLAEAIYSSMTEGF
jgi:outer membrane lipopolysaccharide assembly protein LptE/RlpB